MWDKFGQIYTWHTALFLLLLIAVTGYGFLASGMLRKYCAIITVRPANISRAINKLNPAKWLIGNLSAILVSKVSPNLEVVPLPEIEVPGETNIEEQVEIFSSNHGRTFGRSLDRRNDCSGFCFSNVRKIKDYILRGNTSHVGANHIKIGVLGRTDWKERLGPALEASYLTSIEHFFVQLQSLIGESICFAHHSPLPFGIYRVDDTGPSYYEGEKQHSGFRYGYSRTPFLESRQAGYMPGRMRRYRRALYPWGLPRRML
jgi:hypothetical protein